MSGERVLLVDDEASIVQLARLYLEREGYQVQSVGDGVAALRAVGEAHPAVMVLDVMLPELDGLEVCKRLRAAGNPLPIIMLTARDEDIDKILGLELGADDYMTKPFNPRELVARVKAQLRRRDFSTAGQGTRSGIERLVFGNLEIDVERREVRCGGELIELRAQEFEVLIILAQSQGRVMTRDQLLNLAWGYDFMGQTRTVDVHIAQLRRKLGACGATIETVTGVGYKMIS
jgi:two-component system, OmpR family, alkaline phosphatase synthesis response regulator PhoP